MGRDATKAAGNPWYEARIKASKYNDTLKSREGASEMLGMSVSAVADAELGLTKCMPVDKAVLMADAYGDNTLLNYYCLHECPIGGRLPLSTEDLTIERVTVKLLKRLEVGKLQELKSRLLEIADDGEVSPDEHPDLVDVLEYLKELSKVVSELQTIGEKALGR